MAVTVNLYMDGSASSLSRPQGAVQVPVRRRIDSHAWIPKTSLFRKP